MEHVLVSQCGVVSKVIPSPVGSVAMAGFYLWANKRGARFHQKAEELLALKQEQGHDSEVAP